MIDRSLFTPNGDNPPYAVPFGDGKTVPTSEMAYMLRDLLATQGDVLELGTGSGFQAAVLAEACKSVLSVEVEPEKAIAWKLPENVTLVEADGAKYDSGDEFDGILVTYASPRVEPTWLRQLKDGARLVAPIKLESSGVCRICVYQKLDGRLELLYVPAYAAFVDAK